MLEVQVTVVHVIDVAVVLDLLASIVSDVWRTVIGVDLGLTVLVAIVKMVDMTVVLDRLAAVVGQVLVVGRFGMSLRHDVAPRSRS